MRVEAQHRFSVKDDYRIAEAGALPPEARVELLRMATLRAGDRVSPAAFPDIAPDVAELLNR